MMIIIICNVLVSPTGDQLLDREDYKYQHSKEIAVSTEPELSYMLSILGSL